MANMAPAKNKKNRLVRRAVITDDFQTAISEYFQSKAETCDVRHYPEWDLAKTGPEIELLKTRQELSKTESELATKRVEYNDKRKHMDQQWIELRRKETSLRELFITFDTFVKENYQKRERAHRSITEEKERRDKYEHEISVLLKKLEYMSDIRDKIQHYVKEYKAAQSYLEYVVNETGEFQSITDIFNRYGSLLEARQDLANYQDQNLQALEQIGTDMQRMIEENGHKLLGLNNKLATLEGRFDKAKAEALKWESVVSQIKTVAAEKSLELTQIKSACWNIYLLMCNRKGVPVDVPKDDIEKQLTHIKRTIVQLKRIVKVAKKQAMIEEQNIKAQ